MFTAIYIQITCFIILSVIVITSLGVQYESSKMSRTDVILQGYLFAYGVPLVYFFVLITILVKNFNWARDKLYADFVVKCDAAYEKMIKQQKQHLFAPLHTLVSSNWKLKNEGLIRILEIGVRTGQNLKYYPNNSHIIAVDRNTHLAPYFKADCKKVDHLTVKFISSHAENLMDIPDNTIDAVVATLVLCRAKNVLQVLKEIRRVLAPDGKYYFFEHVHEKNPSFLRRMQTLLSVTKVWPNMFDGCLLNRHLELDIKQAKFKELEYKNLELKFTKPYPLKLVRTHIIGTATK